ncbi:MAG: SDR family oxidoreductase [Solirubrobacterales bacterium]
MAEQPVLLITGASSGIGSETAHHAVKAGYRVVLSARRAGPIEELAAELGADNAIAQTCDVTEWDQMQALVETSIAELGRVDAVFANAGFGVEYGLLKDSVENWRSMVLTNVYGAGLTLRATLPHVLERGTGHFVLMSSVAGRRVLPGSMYSVTKHAVTALAEALRQEIRTTHKNEAIRVTTIAPGMVDTPFFDSIGSPPGWAMEAEDIAGAVAWALQQPGRVDVSEMLIRPTAQAF